jgi:hypothetical protein
MTKIKLNFQSTLASLFSVVLNCKLLLFLLLKVDDKKKILLNTLLSNQPRY